ncbi:MAG TPA: hypothetical protein VFN26_16195 [Candidatus Acidoferrum sp.]|nr:hypothetical protein [Candidatus Acidoferrum sp.]
MGTKVKTKKRRVVSGMRPTGPLHIGHYFGALQNWIRLQNDPSYECFYFVADWHALTTDYANTLGTSIESIEIGIDWLACGLDPDQSTLFVQSAVPEHAELHLLLSMVTPLGSLERVPTYKEQLENIKDKDLHTYGFLGYPVLQSADIVIYSSGASELAVPVGQDQVSHVELTRELVRKFNFHYGLRFSKKLFGKAGKDAFGRIMEGSNIVSLTPLKGEFGRLRVNLKREISERIGQIGYSNFMTNFNVPRDFICQEPVLLEPATLLTDSPRIPGTDGRKMSKSYGNAITLSETNEEIRKKTKAMVTDPARIRRSDVGNPDVCPVYDWHKLFSAEEQGRLEWVRQGCTTATIGCIDCKSAMADNLIKWIEPIREKRLHYQKRRKLVREILEESSTRARVHARATMLKVREAMFGEDRITRHPLRDRLISKPAKGI